MDLNEGKDAIFVSFNFSVLVCECHMVSSATTPIDVVGVVSA